MYSFEEAYQVAAASGAEKCFIIGGASVYKAALPDMDRLYITRVQHVVEDADTFFPELDPAVWKEVSRSEPHTDDGITYEFVVYEKA